MHWYLSVGASSSSSSSSSLAPVWYRASHLLTPRTSGIFCFHSHTAWQEVWLGEFSKFIVSHNFCHPWHGGILPELKFWFIHWDNWNIYSIYVNLFSGRMEGRMDLRASSKFRQTTTGAQLRRRREGGSGLDDRYNTKTFSRQLNHYQTQVTKIYSLLPDYGLVCIWWLQSSDWLLSLCKITIIMIIRYHFVELTKPNAYKLLLQCNVPTASIISV